MQDRVRGHISLERVTFGQARFVDPNTASSTGAVTLTETSRRLQFLNNQSTSDQAVVVPTPGSSNEGLFFHIFNTTTQAGGTMSVRVTNSTGTVVVQIGQNEGCFVASDGATWRGYMGGTS